MAKPTDPNDPIYKMLMEKKATHGSFDEVAELSQKLKWVLHSSGAWHGLSIAQNEALDMMCTKIARAVMGDCDVAEHWNDMAGYATLVAYRCDK